MSYFRNATWNKLETALGVFMIVVGALLFFVGGVGGAIQIGVGLMLIIFNLFFWWTKPLIILHEDYLEMKAAPVAAKFLVRYRDIVALNQPHPKKAHLMVHNSNAQKRINLPLAVLTAMDRDSLVKNLHRRMAKN